VRNAESSSRRLLEFFGRRPSSSLTHDDLDRFVQARLEGVKPKTVNGDLIVLRAILNQAVTDGKIEAPPFKVKLLRTPRKKVLRMLTKKNIRSLLGHAHEPYYGIIYVAASTGFRAAEILHLQWGDVHFDQGQIAITSKNDWTSKSYEERLVYVPSPLLDYLREHRRGSAFPGHSHWVFSSRNGTPLDLHRVCRNVRKVFERARLYQPGHGTLHLIRHSVASRLLQEKVDLETVREILGHSLLSTTALYIHSTNETKRDAASRLEL
jgi:integrase/recombinase XerD